MGSASSFGDACRFQWGSRAAPPGRLPQDLVEPAHQSCAGSSGGSWRGLRPGRPGWQWPQAQPTRRCRRSAAQIPPRQRSETIWARNSEQRQRSSSGMAAAGDTPSGQGSTHPRGVEPFVVPGQTSRAVGGAPRSRQIGSIGGRAASPSRLTRRRSQRESDQLERVGGMAGDGRGKWGGNRT